MNENETNTFRANLSKIKTFEITTLIACLIGIISNFIIIYIFYYRQKRRTTTHLILKHWSLADICLLLLVLVSSCSFIFDVQAFDYPYDNIIICAILSLRQIIDCLTIVFIAMLGLDWLFQAYFSRAYEQFKHFHVFAVRLSWIMAVVSAFVFAGFCTSLNYVLPYDFFKSYLTALFIFVAIINIIHLFRKCRKIPARHPSTILILISVNVCMSFVTFMASFVIAYDIDSLFTIIDSFIFISKAFVNLMILCCMSSTIRQGGPALKRNESEESSFQVHYSTPSVVLLTRP